jgi:hypothetical protein
MLAATLKDNDSAKFNEQTDDKKARPQNGTFGFSRHTSQRSKNQKSHFFANARTDRATIIQTLFILKNEIRQK